MRIQALCLSASVLALTWCSVASAQTAPAAKDTSTETTVKEVVITAERRTTNLQKTAIAATVLSGADLQKKGVLTVDQLQFVAPSVTVNNFGQGNDLDIRGIGKGEHNSQTSTGVITYRDGAATFPGYFQEEPYYDIANVEVLRGPQGTFSGQNATGGAVIVTTANPVINGGYSGYVLAHYGNYNDTGLQGAVNLPISDTLAARVAFNGEYRNSFYDISGPWKGDPNVEWGSARVDLLWKPTSNFTALWKTDVNILNNGGYFGDALLLAPNTPNTETHNLFKFGNDFHTYAADHFVRSTLKMDYVDPNSGITFQSITSGQTGRTAWTGDIDGVNNAANSTTIDEAVSETLLSQEFNIISPTKGPLSWVLGADYTSNNYNFPHGHFDIGFPHGVFDEALEGTNFTHNWALFGQVSYDLPAGFQLQVGGRYSEWYTKNVVRFYVPEFPIPGLFNFTNNSSYSGDNVTGKVTLNWNLDAHNFLYAFVATGAKPGGLNNILLFGGGGTPAPFAQEFVTDYEIGWKSSWFDNHLRTQVGAYDNMFHNFQVIVAIPSVPNQTTELNVPGETKLYGVEGSAEAVFGDFSLNANVGLEKSSLGTFYAQDTRVTGVVFSPTCNPSSGPATATCVNLSGHPQTYAPDVTYNLGAQYNFRLGNGDVITPIASYSHISSQWATLFDNRSQDDYLTPRDIVNLSVSWTHAGYTMTAYSYNLTDDHYVAAAASPIRLAGAPRQFGVSLLKPF
jgi:iron complex outermembrane recepter protein